MLWYLCHRFSGDRVLEQVRYALYAPYELFASSRSVLSSLLTFLDKQVVNVRLSIPPKALHQQMFSCSHRILEFKAQESACRFLRASSTAFPF